MKVFDFDNTIYNGESIFDFALFVIWRKKSLLRYFPIGLKMLFFYKTRKFTVESYTKELEKYMKPFLENQEFIQSLVEEFWEKNIDKLYPHMLKKINRDDVIVTSSPDFLIAGIKDVINTEHILATEIDFKKGKVRYLNFQENKVKLFCKKYKEKAIEEFYTDSYNDEPFMKISNKVFLVKNGKCKKIK